MQISLRIQNTMAIMKLSGRFEFGDHRNFRNNIDIVLDDARVREIALDMSDVDYIDSSALGMLLLLRERAQEKQLPISINNCRGTVRSIMDTVKFDRFFTFGQA